MRNSRLTIKDAVLTQQQQEAFEKAAGDYQIVGYFDIKLAQILYKNSAADLWVNDIAALKNPAKVSLQLGADLEVEGNDLIVIHENSDGTYEVIPASFDSATKTVMFQTKDFPTMRSHIRRVRQRRRIRQRKRQRRAQPKIHPKLQQRIRPKLRQVVRQKQQKML